MHAAIATPHLRLPSQPQGITAPWPSYTAWWQRHVCVNNLPKVVTWKRNAGTWTRDFRSRSFNALTTRQPGDTWVKNILPVVKDRITWYHPLLCTRHMEGESQKTRNAMTQNSWYLRIFCSPNFAHSVCVILTNARSHIHCTLQAVLRCWQGK